MQLVYNLTVEDAHEYIANGVVVSNCDSALYSWRACAGFLESPRAIAADYGTPEWKRKEQDDMLVRDLEEQERKRSEDWWG